MECYQKHGDEVRGPHAVVNGLGRCECGEERKLQEPNKLIVVGNISKKKCPSQIKKPHWPNNQCQILGYNLSMDLSPQHVQVRHSEQMRDEQKSLCKLFVVSLTKLLIWKMTKRKAFWHVDVKNTRLCSCVNPCYHVFGLPIRQKRMTHPAFQRQPSPGLIGQSMGQSDLALTVISPLPSGRHTKNYWTWPFIVDLPIKNGDFP